MVKPRIAQQVKELTIPFHPASLKPSMEADVVFSPSEDTTAACQKYGRVSSLSIADPEKSKATGQGLREAVVGEKSTVDFQAMNFKGTPCTEPVKSLGCEAVSMLTGMRVDGQVERKADNVYSVTYEPAIKGRHQLHIKVEGQPIAGSPFTLTVRSLAEELNLPLQAIHRVEEPWGVALNQRGEAVVTEKGRDCITIFSPSGDKIRSFGSHGSRLGQFKYPRGVAVDTEGHILVADRNNNRIQKFTETGTFLTAVGGKGEFHYPSDIAVNPTNGNLCH